MTVTATVLGEGIRTPRWEVVRPVQASAAGPTAEDYAAARGTALVRLARALLRDPQHAEDVVQEVLAKVFLRWPDISRADDPDAYVRRMVVNRCRSFWRRSARRERPWDTDWLPDREQPDGSAAHADRDLMLRLLRRLPEKQRTVLVLRHYEGLADAEIADLLGTSSVTVRSNAHRGLAALRTLLESQDQR